MLHTVDIRSAFTSADKPIYLKINKDVVPYWIQAAPYVCQNK